MRSTTLECFGRPVTQCAVGPDLLVIPPPELDGFSYFSQGHEPVLVQEFVTLLAVETLDESVLDQFAGLEEVQLYDLFIGPPVQGRIR